MTTVAGPETFDWLIGTLAGRNLGEGRKQLATFSSALAEQFRNDLPKLYTTTGVSEPDTQARLALLLATRQFWALVPSNLFAACDPNYENFAARALEEAFQHPPTDALVDSLSIIFRNLRRAQQFGRRDATSLDLAPENTY